MTTKISIFAVALLVVASSCKSQEKAKTKEVIKTEAVSKNDGTKSEGSVEVVSKVEGSKIETEGPLKGLKKLRPDEVPDGERIMLDPTKMAMYTEDLKPIAPDKFGEMIMSGEYTLDGYFDSNNQPQAFVLRKATAEEKAKSVKMMSEMKEKMESSKNSLMGKKAIPFNVTDNKGNKYSLESLKGKVIVTNFWFAKCQPCVMEMPELNELVDKYKGKNVVFLAFSVDDKQTMENFLKTKAFTYNHVSNAQEVANSYSVGSFPTTIIIDQNSNVVDYSIGYDPGNVQGFDKTIESLLKK